MIAINHIHRLHGVPFFGYPTTLCKCNNISTVIIFSSAVSLKTLCKGKKRGRRDFDGKIERRIGEDLDEGEEY